MRSRIGGMLGTSLPRGALGRLVKRFEPDRLAGGLLEKAGAAEQGRAAAAFHGQPRRAAFPLAEADPGALCLAHHLGARQLARATVAVDVAAGEIAREGGLVGGVQPFVPDRDLAPDAAAHGGVGLIAWLLGAGVLDGADTGLGGVSGWLCRIEAGGKGGAVLPGRFDLRLDWGRNCRQGEARRGQRVEAPNLAQWRQRSGVVANSGHAAWDLGSNFCLRGE